MDRTVSFTSAPSPDGRAGAHFPRVWCVALGPVQVQFLLWGADSGVFSLGIGDARFRGWSLAMGRFSLVSIQSIHTPGSSDQVGLSSPSSQFPLLSYCTYPVQGHGDRETVGGRRDRDDACPLISQLICFLSFFFFPYCPVRSVLPVRQDKYELCSLRCRGVVSRHRACSESTPGDFTALRYSFVLEAL